MPSGYKTSVLFSERPMDTDGQIAFSRASNATRVDANGLVEKVRTNLLTYSNTFSNAAWIKDNGATVTAGQSGYDGSTNAWKLEAPTAGGSRDIDQYYSASAPLTFSVYAKAGTTDWIRINLSGIGNQYFNLANGTAGSGSGIPYSITPAGNGYYRISISGLTGSISSVYIFLASGDVNTNVSAGDNIYIQDAQLETGDIATDYIPTTTSARSTFAGTTVDGTSVPNLPRIDYSGTEGALLLEPQRTNLCLWSEQLDNAGWSKSTAGTSTISVTANYAVSPDGYKNADRIQLIRDAVGYAQASQTISISSGQSYTFSVYLKSLSGTPTIMFGSYGGTNAQTATLTNEWVRYTWTATSPSTSAFAMLMIWGGIGSTSTSADFLAWGYQFEQGSYATSYIPTLATSVTRVADQALLSNSTVLPTAYPFTLFADFEVTSATEGQAITFSNSALSNEYFSIDHSGGLYRALSRPSGVISSVTSTIPATVGFHKICGVFTSTTIKLFVDGVLVASGANAQAFNSSINDIFVGQLRSVLDTGFRNSVKNALVLKSELTDAQAIALTTL